MKRSYGRRPIALGGARAYGSRVKPLIWSDRRAGLAAAGTVGWLVAIEATTSRTASRRAADAPDEQVVDTATGSIFDACAAVALIGGVASSVTGGSVIRRRCAVLIGGLVALVGSGVLSTVARRHLGRFHRDALTIHGDHELVDTGPYARIRHPLYTATIGAFVGIGAVLGTRVSLLLAALPTGAIVHRIRVEEPMLVAALGEQYEAYAQRTNRLIPAVW